MFENEDDQYLDNQDELQEDESDLVEDDSQGDEPEQPRKGNLAAALREEREKRKQYEQRLNELHEKQARQEALLSKLGQTQQTPQDREARLEDLRTRMYDDPESIFQQRDQHLIQQMRQMNAPIAISSAQSFLSNHPEYGDVYNIPQIRQAVDQHIQQAANNYGYVDTNELASTLSGLKELAQALSSSPSGKISQNNGKARLHSTAGKGTSNGSSKLSEEEQFDKALKTMSPRDYSAWEKANRDLVGRVLQSKNKDSPRR